MQKCYLSCLFVLMCVCVCEKMMAFVGFLFSIFGICSVMLLLYSIEPCVLYNQSAMHHHCLRRITKNSLLYFWCIYTTKSVLTAFKISRQILVSWCCDEIVFFHRRLLYRIITINFNKIKISRFYNNIKIMI